MMNKGDSLPFCNFDDFVSVFAEKKVKETVNTLKLTFDEVKKSCLEEQKYNWVARRSWEKVGEVKYLFPSSKEFLSADFEWDHFAAVYRDPEKLYHGSVAKGDSTYFF